MKYIISLALMLSLLLMPFHSMAQSGGLKVIPPWEMRICMVDKDIRPDTKPEFDQFATYDEEGAKDLLFIDAACFGWSQRFQICEREVLQLKALNINYTLQLEAGKELNQIHRGRILELEHSLDVEMVRREAAEENAWDSWDVLPWIITVGLVGIAGGLIGGMAIGGGF